jgi:hypothetical protein
MTLIALRRIWLATPLVALIALVGSVNATAGARHHVVLSLPGPLVGVDAIASDDVWAVGSRPNPADADEDIGLAEHWDGTSWKEFRTPKFGELTAGLVDVSMSGPSDGFAVGSKGQRSFRDRQIVVERWDGSAWTVSPAPDQSFNDVLTGVSARSPNDAWAVGAYSTGGTGRGHILIEHWNGTRWTIMAAPDVGPAELNEVDALAKDDVWAVGFAGSRTLILHWDGASWRRVPSPNRGSVTNELSDVSGAGRNDVWAVGTAQSGEPYPGRTIALHWDGVRWTRVASSSPSSGDVVTAVAAVSTQTAWMVGSYSPTALRQKGLTEHFTGDESELVPVPGVAGLAGVAGVADDDMWAVGPGIYHWNGAAWRRVARPA